MKKSIFTLMALMATAVCGLTSCNDSDDDYVAPAAAAAGVAPESLTTGIQVTWNVDTPDTDPDFVPQPHPLTLAEGWIYEKKGDTTATYTQLGNPDEGRLDSVLHLDFATYKFEMRDEEGNPVGDGTFTVL